MRVQLQVHVPTFLQALRSRAEPYDTLARDLLNAVLHERCTRQFHRCAHTSCLLHCGYNLAVIFVSIIVPMQALPSNATAVGHC